ncbi:MraY family glycosyltransferase [Legionella adelaidensis]|nr:glycosyltransferase family 4 protein [Legionella adelaidensis]
MPYILSLLFLFSFLITAYIRHMALQKNMLDIPNARSSHVIPTPRGGGLGFVVSFSGIAIIIYWLNFITVPLLMCLLSGLFIAFIGLWDDLYSMSAKYRLLAHFAASAFALYWLGGMPAVKIFSWNFSPGLLANFVAIIYLVWLLNLYNFMDGIDGLAGMEALSVCLGGALLYWVNGSDTYILPLALAVAVAGFLYWNFPRARIFMGDVGSGFLGVTLGILSIQAAGYLPQLFWSWLILLGVFIVDATITLIRRAMQKRKLFEAHRTHAYQHATQKFESHSKVTLAILGINIFWLLPLAFLVSQEYVEGISGFLIAYVPLVLLAIKYKAGKLT